MTRTLLVVRYYWRKACLIIPQQVNRYYKNNYKVIQAYQKKYSIGHTDVEQRKKDVFACRVKNYNGGNLDGNVLYPDMTDEEGKPRRI